MITRNRYNLQGDTFYQGESADEKPLVGVPINSLFLELDTGSFYYFDEGWNTLGANNILKVMTYNVGQWYIGSGTNVPSAKDTEYYNLQNGMIKNDGADILFLEEYWKQFSQSGRTAKSILEQYYPYIHEQGGGSGYFGRCVCSKYPISDYTVHTYSNDSSRYYDSCSVTVGGKSITLVITHLATDSKRVAQCTELITYLSGLNRFICAGDFNTLQCKSTSDEDYTKIIAPLLNAGFRCTNCDEQGFLVTYSDQPTGTYTGCLDNIVTSSNISILSAYVDTAKLSDSLSDKTDHMPLIAVARVN